MLRHYPARLSRALVLFLSGMLLSLGAGAAEQPVRPFVAGTLQKIVAERQGKPFILALWSVSCTHCPEELKTLARLKQANPALDVVLVSTDDADESPRVRELAQRFGLAAVPQWVFADPAPERLRFEIDRRWYGELPRTLFFDRQHRVEAVSGLVPPERLARWIAEHVR
ncbi:TlpA disulfide reductase family protein [Azospira restricta]|uniref:TlpA family protein disulfide reductase n=1 Tax=Azospira restricta TaxID=404405 RepID=A0A974SRU8_9RHOO|nr:TlpA disulfide reductase family protein [Azospira restricta]QRJ65306.1 TlpA family protein disulfide reductase [Azospira restricta]